jgi:hypothetical protein
MPNPAFLTARWVTNDGCPISARFWQMWDSTNIGPLSVQGVDARAPFFKERPMKFAEPTTLHRKSGIWGTRHSLEIKIRYWRPSLTLEVREKCGLIP